MKNRKFRALKWPKLAQWKKINAVLSKKEKIFTIILAVLILLSSLAIIALKNRKNSIAVPAPGGEYIEGMAGQPQHINPVLAPANDIDSDLAELIFSGLFRYSEKGELINDIASECEISEDKKTYVIALKDGIFWHDGERLDSNDVLFTAQTIANPAYKSPLRQSLESVEFQIENELKIRFILKEPYAPFLHNLTFKILPSHIWQNIPPSSFQLADGNLKPVGSGPFRFESLKKGKDGFIYSITLEKFEEYFQNKPFLQTITFKFFPDEESLLNAYNKKEILGINKISGSYQEKIRRLDSLNIFKTKLPQYFAVFFNPESNKILSDKSIRSLLARSINKDDLANKKLESKVERIDSFASFFYAENETPKIANISIEEAKNALENLGWKDLDGDGIREKSSQKMEFSLITADHPQLSSSAQFIKEQWESLGIKINLDIKNLPDLQGSAIKNRNYDMLIFGQSLGGDPDLYAFWHSSQKNYPGLNLAMFSSPAADKILESIRKEFNHSAKSIQHAEFQKILSEEYPAIFLFTPYRIYAVNNKVKNIEIGEAPSAANRFAKINNWHIKIKYERRNKNISKAD